MKIVIWEKNVKFNDTRKTGPWWKTIKKNKLKRSLLLNVIFKWKYYGYKKEFFNETY